jgi:arsenical pump membrane protein
MPPLEIWLVTFGLPSVAAIGVTYLVLRRIAAKYLDAPTTTDLTDVPLRPEGKLTLLGIALLAIVLMLASAVNIDLGAPACVTGLLVALFVCLRDRGAWRDIVTGVSWSVLPLVAGLFILVEALNRAGALRQLGAVLMNMKHWQPAAAALSSGFGVAFVSNLINNLPSGLMTAAAIKSAHASGPLRDAILVGVDLGPNLSVTGSLATILWLIAIRREGLEVSFWQFLKWGLLVMPPALFVALLTLVRP